MLQTESTITVLRCASNWCLSWIQLQIFLDQFRTFHKFFLKTLSQYEYWSLSLSLPAWAPPASYFLIIAYRPTAFFCVAPVVFLNNMDKVRPITAQWGVCCLYLASSHVVRAFSISKTNEPVVDYNASNDDADNTEPFLTWLHSILVQLPHTGSGHSFHWCRDVSSKQKKMSVKIIVNGYFSTYLP